ncbi:alpha-glucuronidase family glycosyl hydrolase [Segetibacter sp.]|uniref:alpha-glucuronidase family glycosyl hydrolase n=1 Tax=Segetibacter sp. TaxID=2231182 RepID=UPI0026069BA4|nr:alpha-glucuronidase family glycosyl hydrolase [Segetibacter sp.]MCW3079053.1 Alpha-glucuronidase [Segetibacter sp.]
MKKILCLCLFFFSVLAVSADDGYRLWLRYELVSSAKLLANYRSAITSIHFPGTSPSLNAAKDELQMGLEGLLGKKVSLQNNTAFNQLVIGTAKSNAVIAALSLSQQLTKAGDEGFVIVTSKQDQKNIIAIAANTDVGVLHGVFHFLRLLQTQQNIQNLSITSAPKIKYRLLNHWDNLNRFVERGYAGFSIWNWHTLPGYIDQRYIDYARANASIGINGAVITNVNANALILTKEYLEKVAALADVFRPYGIKIYLTGRFSAPIEIGKLKTADPLNADVKQWWKNKIDEIYTYIPDFGGFLIKANSEGQPGPQDYKRSHADGANMFAEALAPHGGIVMWRSFVYNNESPEDRLKQAYTEFKPLDGKFNKNVAIQVKNGPLDFQPREPFSPLFGAMPKTPLFMEYQLTQEYLGFSTHLVYMAPLFKEVLNADTYEKGKGSTVAKVLDGSLGGHALSGMAGVSNIGNDINWTGHPFGQSNWYTLGRLAWDHEISSAQIANEWIRQTFGNSRQLVDTVEKIMLSSREAMVNYMTPLGLHHIMGYGHHYGPAPWFDKASRADWNPVYFHKADSIGIGFDRTEKGTNYLSQYAPELKKLYENINTCPEEYLLWFHHVAWDHRMKSGRTLWNEICYRYNVGVVSVRLMQKQWNSIEKQVDKQRFNQVKMLLAVQEKEAVWWRNSCLLYFQTFSKMPIPSSYEKPDHTLEYYKDLSFPLAPGNGR